MSPTWLLDLVTAVRKSGLAVVEVEGWQTRGHGPMEGLPFCVICHHTAGPATGEFPSKNVVVNGRPDLDGPLSNLGLGRSGTVYVIAAGLAYHAGPTFEFWQSNGWSIGIEAEATGKDPWPSVQVNAYARLCRALCDHYSLSYDCVLGHKEVAKPLGRKIDPNFDMTAFRSAVANVGAKPAPSPTPRLHGEDAMYIKTVLNPTAPKASQVVGYAILSGPIFIGLDSAGERAAADLAIGKGALEQWVEKSTWDRLAAWSHNMVDNPRPVRVVDEQEPKNV